MSVTLLFFIINDAWPLVKTVCFGTFECASGSAIKQGESVVGHIPFPFKAFDSDKPHQHGNESDIGK